MERLLITSPLPVTLNNYIKPRAINGMAMMYETSEAKKFKKQFIKLFIDEVEKQEWESTHDRNDFYIVHATWYFDKQNRDSNNMWKIMLDAITDTQLVWLDDRQTIERTVRIFYDTENPMVELEIFKAKWVGVFNSQEQHDEFVFNNCTLCSKNKENCTIYKNALESRIKPDELDTRWMQCLKIKIPKPKKGKKNE